MLLYPPLFTALAELLTLYQLYTREAVPCNVQQFLSVLWSSCTLRELLSFTCCRLCCCPLCGTNKQTRAAAPLTLRQCRHPSSSRQICAIFFPKLSKASLHCAHCMAPRHICICLLGRVQASVLPQEGRSRWGREGGWENN